MFGFLKSLLRKGGAGKVPTPAPVAAPSPASPSRAGASPGAAGGTAAPARPAAMAPALVASEDVVAIGLAAILARLPADLKTRVTRVPKADVTVPIARAHLVGQLPRGEVRMRWGDLRRLAPAGSIAGGADRDAESVEIPLPEVLARLGTGSMGLRRDQRRVEIPEEVGAVFGPKGRAGTAAAAAAAKPAVGSRVEPPAVSKAEPVVGAKVEPEVAKEELPAPRPPEPSPAVAAVVEPVKVVVPPETEPIRPKVPLPDLGVGRGAEGPRVVAAEAGWGDARGRMAAPVLMPGTAVAQVELGSLMGGWPESVRGVLAGWRGEMVFVPLGELEAGFRAGRVRVTWGQLQGWMAQAPGATLGEDEVLELPLAVLAPLFMQVRKPAGARRELRVEEEIPALFGPKGPAAAPAAVAAEAGGRSAPGEESAPAGAGEGVGKEPAAGPLTIGDALGEPGRTEWSPVDLVRATAVLEGVAGAVVTMHDGFLVAAELPPEQDAEAFGALVPELHGRVNQFASDLRLNPQAVVTVTIGEVPLRIQRTPSVFLGVLGRAGKALPLEKLAVIVKHLD